MILIVLKSTAMSTTAAATATFNSNIKIGTTEVTETREKRRPDNNQNGRNGTTESGAGHTAARIYKYSILFFACQYFL
ncbi:hypothetical protein R80B4_00241 [Fibrobacteres bacterium R8-0-B4]